MKNLNILPLEPSNIPRDAALRDIPRSKAKCLDFHNARNATDAKLLTSFITVTISFFVAINSVIFYVKPTF